MKTKTRFHKLTAWLLTLAMLMTFIPSFTLTAFAASDYAAYAPIRRENYLYAGNAIFANGTPITIEAAPNGTRVWYMDGTTKKYVTNNGENGEDLSGWSIYVGSYNPDGMSGVNGSVTMTGGTVMHIYAGQYSGSFRGTSNITITGGTVKGAIHCNPMFTASGDSIGTITIYDATGATIKWDGGHADNVVQKNGSTWSVWGNAIIPDGVTLTVNEGETLTVPTGSTITNNGTLINNGGMITVYGQLKGNAPQNYVEPSDFVFSTTTLNANVSTTLTKPTASPDNTTLEPWFTYEIFDAGTTGAVTNGSTITPYGAGTVKVKVIMHDGYCTPIEKVYEFPVSFTPVTGISGAVPTECWVNRDNALPTSVTPSDASYQTVVWSVVDAGTTEAAVSGYVLRAKKSGTATIRATVANGTAYGSDFTKDYTVTFKSTDIIDIGLGSVVVNKKDDTTVTVTYAGFSGGSKDYSSDEPIVITGTSNSNTIEISGGTMYIVLDEINLATGFNACFNIYSTKNATVTLELVGENTISGGTNNFPTIFVGITNTLIIDGEGSLVVTKPTSSIACIGGAKNEDAGTIIINGGTIVADNINAYKNDGTGAVINGGNIKASSISGVLQDEDGNSLSLNTITLNGAANGTVVTNIEGTDYGLRGVKTLDDKLYFYLPSGTELPTSITAGGNEYICNRNLTYYTEHEALIDLTCLYGKRCPSCGYTEGEPLGHNYVDGICTRCSLDENGVYHIKTAEQLTAFAILVNEGNTTANAVLEADIDLENHTWTPIGVTAIGESVTDGYTGTFDGQGHVISNITFATPTSEMAAGIFGTVQSGGTVKNLGVENLTFDNNDYDHRAGGIAGQLLADSSISDCYVINSTVKASSRVVGGIVGMNKGTVENCYTYNMTLAGYKNRFGGISGDYTGGTLKNCYTNHSALASSQAGTTTNCEAGVSAEQFASGEIAYKLNGSTSVGNLAWGQTIGEDAYPVLGGATVYYDDTTNGYNNHVHEWEYTVVGNIISANCTATDCPNTNGGSVTIATPDSLTYTGEPIEAKVTNTLTTGDTATVVYTSNGNVIDGKPVNVGTYTASITLSDKKIDVTYSIIQKELTVKSATATAREYDGTNVVEITAVELEGICGTDAVAVDTIDLTGTISGTDASATAYDIVTLPTLTLVNNEKGNYKLTQPMDAVATTVTINPVSEENFKNLISLQYSVNGGEYTQNAPTTLSYENKLKVKISFDLENKGSRELPDDNFYVGLGEKVESGTLDATTGEVEIEVDTPNVGTNVDLKVYYSNPKNYALATFYDGTVNINKKSVTFNNISGTDQIYESGVAREITFTPSSLTTDDYTVKYYRVDENNKVLASATPVANAIEPAKYLYVIDFANTQTNYEIANKFTVSGTALPDDVENYGNVGYMLIKSGVTGQQTPIYFKDGTVNLKVNDTYTNKLTNDNGTAPTFTSSNTDVATVDSATGEVTAVGKGTATITAKSEKDETTPVYASYTVNVGLATKTLTADDFTVTAKDKTYDGTTDVVISAVLNDGVIYEGDNIKVDITGEFASADVAETGKNTVNYKITGISGTGAENYVLENGQITGTTEATINKAKVTIICAATTTRTFDGTAQSVDVSAMANGAVFDSSNYTVKYNGGEAPSAVGSYPVTVELTEEAAKNYTVTQPSATLVIKSATQEVFSIEGVPEAVYYGDSFTLSAEGASGTVTYAITSGADYATINGANVTIKGVGKVTITATSVKDGYIDKLATKTFNAKQRILTPTATATDRTYNGENGVEVEISLANVVDGDTITATATGSMINADAGDNKIVYVSGITLEGAKKDLYTLDTTSIQTTVDIAKKKIEEITVSASDKKYDGNENATATVETIKGVIDADAGQVEVIGSAVFADANSGKNKTVTFTATGLSGSKAANYYIDGTLTAETTAKINPVTVNFVVGQTTFVYDGSNKNITLSASDEFGRIFTEFDVEYDNTPNAAGTYTATVVLTDAVNYTTSQDDITVTIEKATQDNLVIVGLPGTIEYKGSFELEAVGGEDGGAYEWTAPEGVTLSFDDENDKSKVNVTIGEVVGEKVEIEVVKKTDNYEDISAKVVFVPTAKVVTFDISNLEQTYGEVTDVVVAPSDEDTTYDVTYNGGVLPTDAGTYTVKVTANGNYSGMQTATLTIKKATATGTITGIKDSYTYGEAITGVDVTDLKDNTSAEITYAGTGIYVPQDEAPTKVGNYTVIATITGTNYETLTLTENFVIEKKELTVKAVDTERAYGEANPIFKLEYTGFVNGEDKDVLLAEPIATVNANASSGVDEYEIKVSGGSAENYKFKYDNTGKLTVKAAGGTLYITGSTNTAYVNDVFTLHAFIGNSKVNVTWESNKTDIAEIDANGTVTAKKAGTVTITAKADANYGNATATFNITVKQTGITLVPTGLVKTYTGERQDISFAYNADFSPVIGENVKVEYILISNPEVKEPIQAGTYSVVYTIMDDSYTGGGNTTMYINKATVNAKVKDDSKVYGDEYTGYDLEITDNGTLAESVQASVLDEIKSFTTYASEGAAKTAMVKDGGYEIIPTLSKSETDNVIFTVENGTLTVNKAPLTVKVKDVTREYGAENPTLEAEYTGFKNEETENTENIFTGELALTYDESINAETAVGEYADKTTASGLEAANYNITFESGNVTITKIPVTASAGTSRSSYLTVKFDKAIEGLTKDNFTVMNGETPVEITEVTPSTDNKSYTLKGTFDTSVTYTVTPSITSETHEITSEPLSIKPTRSSGGTGGGGGGGSVTTSYTVKFETDGADEIKDVKVTKNKTVAEPTEPTKDGYTFMGWFTDEELTKAYDFETKVTKNITLYAKWEKVDDDKQDETDDKTDTPVWENPFEDVKADDWYYADVEYAAENGLFNGTSETTFAPNGIITRAMMVTVLYRNEGEPEITGETTFEDVDENAYYAKAVVWGQQNGIIKGYSETEFAPDENITREQIAAIMFRYATYKGVAPTGAWAIRLEYADLAEIADYATEGVMYCTKDGLMQGKGNDMFFPKDNATRAEIAAILHRFIEANK